MGTFVIYNPAASRSCDLDALLENCGGLELQWCSTSRNVGAEKLARQAVENGFSRIVVLGGDGTVNEVVNGIAPDFSVELAIVPCGTGNDLARGIGIPLDSQDAAFEIALKNDSRFAM